MSPLHPGDPHLTGEWSTVDGHILTAVKHGCHSSECLIVKCTHRVWSFTGVTTAFYSWNYSPEFNILRYLLTFTVFGMKECYVYTML